MMTRALVMGLVVVFGVPCLGYAQNGITVSPLIADSRIHSVGVKAPFTGDTNQNASAVFEWRVAPSGAWAPFPPHIIDYRVLVRGGHSAGDCNAPTGWANPGAFQARSAIFGITADTTWDVRVTWSDPDGVTGTNPVVATVTTLPVRPKPATLNGDVYHVSATAGGGGDGLTELTAWDWAEGELNIVAGDTVQLHGTFPESTITVDGTFAQHIKYQGPAIFSGGVGASSSLIVNGDYIWVQNVTVEGAQSHSAQANGTGGWYTDMTFGDAALAATNDDAALFINTGNTNVRVIDTTFTQTTVYNFSGGQPFAPNAIVMGSNSGNISMIGLTVTGPYLDGLGGGAEASQNAGWSDGMEVTGVVMHRDQSGQGDGIEIEGKNMNTAAWGNTVTGFWNNAYGLAPTTVGPTYFVRNIADGTVSAAMKMGNGGSGMIYAAHNTLRTFPAAGSQFGIDGKGGPSPPCTTGYQFYNNILMAESSLYRTILESSMLSDGNVFYGNPHPPTTFSRVWVAPGPTETTSTTFANYQANHPTLDVVSVEGDPLLQADRSLGGGSPAIDLAVAIPFVNSSGGPFAPLDGNPDTGAIETFLPLTMGATNGPVHRPRVVGDEE